jgi:glycosyltransferase involved in cell wall biosynthesis
VSLARGDPRLRFEPWVDYRELAARIHRAHVLLGAFGVTPKAGRVIPNKVYQALACARPVVTRAAPCYPPLLLQQPGDGLCFVPAGDAAALASALDAMSLEADRLALRGQAAGALYARWFSAAQVRRALAALLSSLDLPCAPAGHAAA